jgi:hypothetical protein
MSDMITPEQAGGALEGETLAFDADGDAYVLPSGRGRNLVALAARDDNGDILNPEIWRELVRRFNAYPALTALAAAQQAQIERLRKLLREAVEIARSEGWPSSMSQEEYQAVDDIDEAVMDCAGRIERGILALIDKAEGAQQWGEWK